jgi:predicted outer membrane protein
MEVELAKLAEQRATNPEVKQFAQKMVADHNQLLQKLQTFAATTGRTPGGAQPGRPAEAGAGRTDAPGQGFDHVGLVEELGSEFLNSARGELEKKQGAEFDQCYAVMAVAGHMKADDMMTVFERHASGELATAIKAGHAKVEQHLEEARRLAESVKQK